MTLETAIKRWAAENPCTCTHCTDLYNALRDAAGAEIGPKEVCICAAVRLPNGYIVRGHRHDDAIQTAGMCWARQFNDKPFRATTDTQGFVTSHGRFIGRAEAMQLQRAAGATRPDGESLRGDILFSEDLY